MKATKQRFILTDGIEDSKNISMKYKEWYTLDPVMLFSKLDWIHFEENVQLINQVYSEVFDEIVVNKKSLLCYWPLSDCYIEDWYGLHELFKDTGFELEIEKKENQNSESSDLNKIILKKWKGFVSFLLETLFEDVLLNNHIDQIATLSNGSESLVLFRMDQNGCFKYSFALINDFLDLTPSFSDDLGSSDEALPFFNSFTDMIDNLLVELDLGSYKIQFNDKQLEKTYYNRISKAYNNLIQNWIDTYSLN
jgi:hypothetical protein